MELYISVVSLIDPAQLPSLRITDFDDKATIEKKKELARSLVEPVVRLFDVEDASTAKRVTDVVKQAYAISYKPQKILESYEGGEKPDVTLIGHYHKLDAGMIRNDWYAQVGCQQDQTPFMRQRSLEAHVGGILLEMEQDPKNGSISGFKPDMKRYYSRSFYFMSGQGNQRWSGHGPIKQVPRKANTQN